ncbi:SDR family oxidoreductase [Antrihabitans cavernicola]|uniref:NAD-dependent epimerase/dehydratase family protein n=1 Tax=Antrihabitans cavernicola TaxID=2495913 RepID=A0A5A7SE29_9NOCA|nr:NAD(P)H-binding protein [Spelaeibacter cavernicola]KAA0024116.1 NAD-dependent epimerase/dehydratase family protein [Spelaeibacter cavernicola]
MTGAVLVTGGTGTLGRAVVDELLAQGSAVRVLSRCPHDESRPNLTWALGDLRTGVGVDDAIADVQTVVHCATTNGKSDVSTSATLIDAIARAGGVHLVYISIVGVDVVPMFYYRAKLEVERAVERAGVPFTILRATQFHDLVVAMSAAQRWLPATLVPSRTSFQPIDVRDVARRLSELVAAGPSGRVPDIGGPQVRRADDLARTYLHAVGRRRLVASVRLPGGFGAGYRAGGHLAADNAYGTITFDNFLAR